MWQATKKKVWIFLVLTTDNILNNFMNEMWLYFDFSLFICKADIIERNEENKKRKDFLYFLCIILEKEILHLFWPFNRFKSWECEISIIFNFLHYILFLCVWFIPFIVSLVGNNNNQQQTSEIVKDLVGFVVGLFVTADLTAIASLFLNSWHVCWDFFFIFISRLRS